MKLYAFKKQYLCLFLKKKKKGKKKHSSFFPLFFVFCFLFNNSFCFNLFYNPPNDRQRERFSMADGSLIVFIFLMRCPWLLNASRWCDFNFTILGLILFDDEKKGFSVKFIHKISLMGGTWETGARHNFVHRQCTLYTVLTHTLQLFTLYFSFVFILHLIFS